MKKTKIIDPITNSSIRQKAEELLKNKQFESEIWHNEADTLKLIHELEVHQIELELQNEELLEAKANSSAAIEKFTELYDLAPSGYFTLTRKGEIIELNHFGANMLGKERMNLINSLFGFFVSDDTKPTFNLFLGEVFKHRKKEACEVFLLSDDNSLKYVHLSGIISEKLDYCLINAFDLTELKLAEEKIKKEQILRNEILERLPLIALILKKYTREIVATNKLATDAGAVIGKTCYETLTKCNHNCPFCKAPDLWKTGEEQTIEAEYLGRYWEGRWIPLSDDLYVHFILDITDRKLIEDALRNSEENMRYIIKHDPNAIAVYDRNMNYIAVSDRYLEDYNVEEIDILGKHHYEVFPEMPQRWKDVHQRCMSGVIERNEDDSFERPDGSITYNRWECRPWYKVNGDIGGIITYTEVTTDRKRAEILLRESEARYRDLIFSIADWVWELDENGVYTFSSGKGSELLGLPTEKIIGKTPFDFMRPDEAKRVADIFKEIVQKRLPIKDLENWNISKNDNEICLLTNGVPIFDIEGNLKGYRGVDKDITRRKKAERLLKESEERVNFHINNSPLGTIEWNQYFEVTRWSGESEKIFGWNQSETLGKSIEELSLIYEEDIPVVKNTIRRLTDGTSRYIVTENRNITRNGRVISCEWYNSVLMDANGKMVSVLSQILDITDRKIIERQIRESEKRYRSLFENMLNGYAYCQMLYDNAGKPTDFIYLDVNDSFYRLTGLANVKGKKVTEVVPGIRQLDDELFNIYGRVSLTGVPEHCEIKVNSLNNWFSLSVYCPLKNHFVAIFDVITERKKNEEKIRTTSIYTRSLIEAGLDPLVTISIDGKITDANYATEKITGIKREKLIGSDFADYFSHPEKARKGYRTVFSKGIVRDYPLTIVHNTGQKIDVLYNATLYKNENGEVQGVFAAARDITEQKKLELEIKNSKLLLEKLNKYSVEIRENERTIISREIHDQLGQSLTATKMDLNMMLETIPINSDLSFKLKEIIERVTTISSDVQRISSELRPPILDDLGLSSAMEWYCEEFAKRTGLVVQMELEDVQTGDINKDLCIYRVLQESLTNIIRHSRASKVQVNLQKIKKSIVLIIKDNGIGITKDKIKSSKSLGILGMSERIKQSGGKFQILTAEKGGTTIKILIPVI